MSVLSPAFVDTSPTLVQLGLRNRLARFAVFLGRLLIAAFLCTQFLTAVVVVGWSTRWMRRIIWQGWWQNSAVRDRVSLRELARLTSLDLDGCRPPRWFVVDRFRERWNAPTKAGLAPSRTRSMIRLPRLLLGGLVTNFLEGVRMVGATLCVTGPGCFLMLAGWRYGWDNSFNKGYEQALTGRITALIGIFLFIPALWYVPMGWSHLAATGRFRSFFDRRLIFALTKFRLLSITFWMAGLVVLAFPLHVAWVRVYNAVEEFPWLADATEEQVRGFGESYVFNTALLLVPLFLIPRVLAARIYRGGLPGVLAKRPELGGELEAPLWTGLSVLGIWQKDPARRRHLLVATVLWTGRRVTRIALWISLFLLSFVFIAEMFVTQFLHAHDFLMWLNPVLIHLPCPRWRL